MRNRQSRLSGAFPHNPVGVADVTRWTIKYEFDCYIAIALLGVAGLLRRGFILVLFLGFAGAYFAQSEGYFSPPHWEHGSIAMLVSDPWNWPRLFSYFFAGSAFYQIRQSADSCADGDPQLVIRCISR
jgi:peptidoglycan/LPS O-acetylase OafA/YrhL